MVLRECTAAKAAVELMNSVRRSETGVAIVAASRGKIAAIIPAEWARLEARHLPAVWVRKDASSAAFDAVARVEALTGLRVSVRWL
jgi:hypothetical protein